VAMKSVCGGDSRVIWSCKDSMGYTWMKNTGVPQIEDRIRSNTAVVCLMGVNDCADTWMADNYASYLNTKAAAWKKLGADTYFISIPPVNDSLSRSEKNSMILAFNKRVKAGLSADVHYVGIYETMLANLATVSDGLHYKNSCTKLYYNLVIAAVETDNSSGYSDEELAKDPDLVVSSYYKPVYNFNDYLNYNSAVKKKYAADPRGAYEHFLNTGMKQGLRGSKEFDPLSYCLRYPKVRHTYLNDWPKYYEHYLTYGKARGLRGTKTTVMSGYVTVYQNRDYKKVYNFNEYVAYHPVVLKTFGYDDQKVLADFVNKGMAYGRRGNKEFNWRIYRKYNPDLARLFGNNVPKYYDHYLRKGYNQAWRRHK
jgi:hypothetical protein